MTHLLFWTVIASLLLLLWLGWIAALIPPLLLALYAASARKR